MASTDVMIDIETLALSSDALVLSIGAVAFDCGELPEMGDTFFATPGVTEQILMGRRVERSTQLFWKDQSPEAQDHWTSPHRVVPVRIALAKLIDFIKTRAGERGRVWANGAVFDIGVLESLYQQCGLPVPWKYNAVRDARTFYDVMPQVRTHEPTTDAPVSIPHHPITDCRVQIIRLWEHGLQ